MVSWPVEYGGRGADLLEWLIFEEEYYRAGAPRRVNQNGIFLLGPTLMEFGTPEQKARYPAEDGDQRGGLGAGLVRAERRQRHGGDPRQRAARRRRLRAATARRPGPRAAPSRDWLFGMFRTDPESERHRGLSFVLVPLDAPGVTVRPIAQLDGETGFAEVFLDDVRVPVANRLGAEGQGWTVAMATAGFERGLMLRSPARFQATARRLVELYRENAARCDPALRDATVNAWMDAEAYTLDTYRTVSRLLEGGKIGAEASLNKIFWSELDLRMHETALRILGERAELLPEAPAARGVGDWLDGFLFALSGPIYAGTNEIQRNVIAERILGLPKGA